MNLRRMPRGRACALALGLTVTSTSGGAQPTNRPSCSAAGLDGVTFGAVLNRRFSALVSPATEGVPGTYLSVDVKDATATAGTTFISPTGLALTVSAHGGVSDGVVAIFNDATLAGKFGAAAQLHFLSGAKQSLSFTTQSCAAINDAARKADSTLALRRAEVAHHVTSVQPRIKLAALLADSMKIAAKLDSIAADSVRYGGLSAVNALKRDSLKLELARDSVNLGFARSAQGGGELADSTQKLNAGNESDRANAPALSLIDVTGYAFGWWTLGVSLENARFDLFDPAAAAAAQLSKRTHLTRLATLTYSRIDSDTLKRESRYVELGAKLGWEDNLADLQKVDVVDRQQYAAPPAERSTEKTTTAYVGDYRDDVETIRVTADLYQFLLRNDRLAYHLFPSYSAKTGSVGQIALGGGLLLSARKPAKDAALMNAEVFFNAPDLADARRTHKSPLRRGVLGLRVTFPFNFTLGG